jgi:energy-converting hydrogenase B subunit D
MVIILTILILLMIVSAVAVLIFKDLMNAVIASCMISLIAAILFYCLQAPDVAMAEAVIGAALITGILVIVVKRTKRFEE